MTTDRELLELAAKAAGYDTSHHWNASRMELDPPVDDLVIPGESTAWNPLKYDGDALRLAVRLGISVKISDPEKLLHPHALSEVNARQEGQVTARIEGSGYRHKANLFRWSCVVCWVSMAEFIRVSSCKDEWRVQFWRGACPEKFENAYTATRRAIVRAAAEIGRNMK